MGNHLDVPTAWTDLHLVSAHPLWDMTPATGRVRRIRPRSALRLRKESGPLPRGSTSTLLDLNRNISAWENNCKYQPDISRFLFIFYPIEIVSFASSPISRGNSMISARMYDCFQIGEMMGNVHTRKHSDKGTMNWPSSAETASSWNPLQSLSIITVM